MIEKVDKAWKLQEEELFSKLCSSENGLSEHEAELRSAEAKNELPEKDRRTGVSIFISQFENPLVYLLIFASILAYFLGDVIEGTVVMLIIVVNSMLGFFLEYKAEIAVRELKKYITFTATVIRDGETKEVDTRNLVVGDIVLLHIGNMVPADIRLLSAEEFQTNESVLTGESSLVEKKASPINVDKDEPQLLTNMAFMGTTVASGHAQGIVTAIGADTFFGKTALSLTARVPQSNFEKSIRDFGNMLLKITLAVTLFVFLANTLLGKQPLVSFLFALALAVGIAPEALPIVITIALSNGALDLAKKKVVVKKLVSLEDLGNVDVFCSDKTGTLSESDLSLEKAVSMAGEPSQNVLEYGVICNTQFGAKKGGHASQVDSAITKFANEKVDKKRMAELEKTRVIDVVDFDYERKRMSVVIKQDGKLLMITKGAPESVISVCSKIIKDGKEVKITPTARKKYEEYAGMGYSVLAVASKIVKEKESFTKDDENGLSLLGFLLLSAPPRKTTFHTVSELRKLGVEMKVLTGDGPIITRKLCGDVGFKINEDRIVLGDELDAASDEEFGKLAEEYNVFARVTPEHKHRIVLALRKAGHVVAFMGDGVNDAPALRAADVGISVNNAVDVAKDAAHIILLSRSLEAVLIGVRDGRKIFGNITKYVLNTISGNFGNICTIALSSVILPFIPMLPAQILLTNLLTDLPMLTISTDNVDSTFLRKPKKWNMDLISNFMIRFGIISSIFDMILIGSVYYWLQASRNDFRTSWFILSVISELVIAFSIRTQLRFYKSRPSIPLLVASIAVCILAIGLVYSPIAFFFQFSQISIGYLALTLFIVLLYFAVVETTKMDFFKKYEL